MINLFINCVFNIFIILCHNIIIVFKFILFLIPFTYRLRQDFSYFPFILNFRFVCLYFLILVFCHYYLLFNLRWILTFYWYLLFFKFFYILHINILLLLSMFEENILTFRILLVLIWCIWIIFKLWILKII